MKGFSAWPGRVSFLLIPISASDLISFHVYRLLSPTTHSKRPRRRRSQSAFISSAPTISKFPLKSFLIISELIVWVFFFSGWIEDINIKTYSDHKSEMIKQGKPKSSFNKAIKEIEEYIKNPGVSFITASLELSFNSLPFSPARSSQRQHVKHRCRRCESR